MTDAHTRRVPRMIEPAQSVEQYAPPRARKISEAAAAAAQHVIDLEAANAELTGQVAQTKNLLQLAEERNAVLAAELLKVKLEGEYHQQRCIEIETKLRTAGAIILDCLKVTPHRSADTVAAVANVLPEASMQ